MLLVGRELAVKIAESIKKEEMKAVPAPNVVGRPPGPVVPNAPMMGNIGSIFVLTLEAQPGPLSTAMTKKLGTPGSGPTVGVPGVAIKGMAPPGMGNPANPGMPNMPQTMNLGQPG